MDATERFDSSKVVSITRTIYPDKPTVEYKITFSHGYEGAFLRAMELVLDAAEYEKLLGMMQERGYNA